MPLSMRLRPLLLALAASTGVACRGGESAPQRNSLVDSRDTYDPRSLDPALSTDVPTGRAVPYVFDGLTRFTPDARGVDRAGLDAFGLRTTSGRHWAVEVCRVEARRFPEVRSQREVLGWPAGNRHAHRTHHPRAEHGGRRVRERQRGRPRDPA